MISKGKNFSKSFWNKTILTNNKFYKKWKKINNFSAETNNT